MLANIWLSLLLMSECRGFTIMHYVESRPTVDLVPRWQPRLRAAYADPTRILRPSFKDPCSDPTCMYGTVQYCTVPVRGSSV